VIEYYGVVIYWVYVLKHSSGDWFFDLFTSEAEKLLSSMSYSVLPSIGEEYSAGWWVSDLPDGVDAEVAAVDGGGGYIQFSGGVIYVVRAYGYISGGEPERLLELKLHYVRDSRVLDSLRTWLELRAARRLLYRLRRGSYLFMDGSLRSTIASALSSIMLLGRRGVSSLSSIYASLYSMYTIAELVELVREARDSGINIVYISKDSSYTVLKEKILLEKIASTLSSDKREFIVNELAWYPLSRRSRLVRVRKEISKDLRSIYDLGLDRSYFDQHFIIDSIRGRRGYSKLIRVPPSKIISSYFSGSIDLLERIAEYTVDVLGDSKDLWEFETALKRFIDKLPLIPSTLSSYVRVSVFDWPFLVEIPWLEKKFFEPGRNFVDNYRGFEDVVSVIINFYVDSAFYNVPLVVAHNNATIDSKQLDLYMRFLENLAYLYNTPLRSTRRTLMARKKTKS